MSIPGIVDAPTQLLIDGRFTDSSDGGRIATHNPATGQVIAEVSAATEQDVDRAVASARAAFESGSWSRLDPADRKAALYRFVAKIEEHAETLAKLDSIEAGKPISDCTDGDLPEVIGIFSWYAEAIDKVFGKVSTTGEGNLGLIVTEPVGVVAAVVPWNFPLPVLTMKLAPALAAGNAVIVKPPEQASLSALYLAKLALDAGIPAGILNVVPGHGHVAGKALGLHNDVDALTFTGSTEVGRYFLEYSAKSNFKKVTLEMGGKSPQIVTESVAHILPRVAEDLADAAFWNSGQNCTAGSRILVHNSIKDRFVEELSAVAARKVVGDTADPHTELGPIIEEEALNRMLHAVQEAEGRGAEVRTGGTRILEETGGWFIAPTVITGVSNADPIAQTELFGPITVVIGYDTEEEAIQIANATEYGLSSTVWSKDIDQAIRLSRRIKSGIVAVNGFSEGDFTTPFGGFKASGFGGKEKGLEAFEQYTETKTIWISLDNA
ncbi:aldehyde dehydrogenase family protein [Leucobacter sp. GX24907]